MGMFDWEQTAFSTHWRCEGGTRKASYLRLVLIWIWFWGIWTAPELRLPDSFGELKLLVFIKKQ